MFLRSYGFLGVSSCRAFAIDGLYQDMEVGRMPYKWPSDTDFALWELDVHRKPLDPCSPARARYLLKRGRAAVFRCYLFTIILKDRMVEDSIVHRHQIKIDPGSKVTGIAIVKEESGVVVAAVEVEHRGQPIKSSLDSRRAIRRGRRNRKPRFDNRRRRERGFRPRWRAAPLTC